jgi:hypothetical protein
MPLYAPKSLILPKIPTTPEKPQRDGQSNGEGGTVTSPDLPIAKGKGRSEEPIEEEMHSR